MVTASEEREREGGRERDRHRHTDTWGGQRARASQSERWGEGGSEREVERLRTYIFLVQRERDYFSLEKEFSLD